MSRLYCDFESNNDVLLVNFYKEYSNTTVLEKGLVDDELEFDDNGVNQSINWDLYDTYKYTFKKVNDKYYFESFGLNQ